MRSQLPQFIKENLVYSCDLHLSRKLRSSLVLLRNLQLYEVSRKQIVNCIYLQNTNISRVQHKFDAWESNKYQTQSNDTLSRTHTSQISSDNDLMIGKYINQSWGNEKIVYILLKCWSYLLVIRRDSNGLTLQKEYTNVQLFRIYKNSGYHNRLAIIFADGSRDIADFEEVNSQPIGVSKDGACRRVLDRIKMKQSELLVHKAITRKEFARLKSTDLFSCNFLRSPRLDEMQVLSKCGNAWYKITTNDDIVVGVPLVNNGSSSLSVLQNFKPVLGGRRSFSYKFAIYQLSNQLCDIESIQSFFTSQNEGDCKKASWSLCSDFVLRPEVFYVLVLKLKGSEVYPHDVGCLPLFACFDIISSNRVFHQQCFLIALHFHNIFANTSCRLSFNQKHLARDLLTIISTSVERSALIEWYSSSTMFEKFLCRELGFLKVSTGQNDTEPMQIDDQSEMLEKETENEFFFNKNPESSWHGTLISLSRSSTNGYSKIKLYTKTHAKSDIFYGLLSMELKANCAIKDFQYETIKLSTKLIKLEAAVRDECESRVKMCSLKNRAQSSREIQKLQKQLYLNELKTDIEWKDLRT